jgi:hypothetical protein
MKSTQLKKEGNEDQKEKKKNFIPQANGIYAYIHAVLLM